MKIKHALVIALLALTLSSCVGPDTPANPKMNGNSRGGSMSTSGWGNRNNFDVALLATSSAGMLYLVLKKDASSAGQVETVRV